MQQDQRLLQFLMKDLLLLEVINVLMQQPLPNLSNAFEVFSQEKRHQLLSQSGNQIESLAFLPDSKRNVKQGYYNSQQQS